MSAPKSFRSKQFRHIAIAATCWLAMMANTALAQKPVATPENGPAARTGASETSQPTDTKGGAAEGPSTDPASSTSSSSSGSSTTQSGDESSNESSEAEDTAQNGGTDAKVTATEASVTPLDTAASDDQSQESYGPNDKKRVKLLQQHEAVQHFLASQSYAKEWDYELAELEVRAAIMYMPEMKIAHRDYCLIAMIRCKPLRALAEFFMVVGLADPIPLTEDQQKELRTEASQAHYKKGLDKATEGKWDDAITELLWARTYLPNDPAILRSLGFAYGSKGDFKMAEQYYRSSIDIDPGNAFARADFAFLLAKKGKKDQAVAEMTEAVKTDPDSTALHVDLGWLAEAQGDIVTAEKEFRAAVKRSPQYTALWMHLGQILEKQNKLEGARQAYLKAIEAERSNGDAKAALARLDKTASPASSNPKSTTPASESVTPLDKESKESSVQPAVASPDSALSSKGSAQGDKSTDKKQPASGVPNDQKSTGSAPGDKPSVTPLRQ